MELGEEIHHLQEQQMADIDGFIEGYIPKNHPGNLLTVCKKCHDMFHTRPISPITVDSNITEKKKIVRKKTTKGYILQSK
jgi:predicted HNH restriction endonuclease